MPTEMSCSDESCHHDEINVDFDAMVSPTMYHSHEACGGKHRPVDQYNIVSPQTLPSGVAEMSIQRRNALGYSVLTQANAELACNAFSAEQHWERIAAKSPHYQRTLQQDNRAMTASEQTADVTTEPADPFPLLVTPRSSNFATRAMSILSMMTPPPTPPLWRRNKRQRDNDCDVDDDFSGSMLPLPSPPLTFEKTVTSWNPLRPSFGVGGADHVDSVTSMEINGTKFK